MEQAIKAIANYISEIKATSEKALEIQDACTVFKAIREIDDEIKSLKKSSNAVKESMARTIMPQLFKEKGTTSITVDGFRFTMSETVRATIKADQKAEAYEWLRENELGDLITQTVNASTLASAARAELEAGRELDEDFFNVAIVPNTSVTKS